MLSGVGRDRLVESPNEVELEFMGNLHILIRQFWLGCLSATLDLIGQFGPYALSNLTRDSNLIHSKLIRQFGSPAFHKQAV